MVVFTSQTPTIKAARTAVKGLQNVVFYKHYEYLDKRITYEKLETDRKNIILHLKCIVLEKD